MSEKTMTCSDCRWRTVPVDGSEGLWCAYAPRWEYIHEFDVERHWCSRWAKGEPRKGEPREVRREG